jgi:thioredoxin reductase (NADPH)
MEVKRAGMHPLVIDKGCLCNSIYHYPVNMVFFTTPELLEIGDLPMTCAAEKPTRAEALKYYRRGVEHYALELRLFERVLRVDGHDGTFTVVTELERGGEECYQARKVVIATGYYDLPNQMGVPGEHAPHVSHYYTEPHSYWNQDVAVIGGKNSAVEAALDLWRNGARVTLLVRGPNLGKTIKYWVKPDIENRIKAEQIHAIFNAHIKEIVRDGIVLQNGHPANLRASSVRMVPAKQVFALTGYHPDYEFIQSLGVKLDEESRKPDLNANTLESNVKGLYLAGVVIGGKHTSEIFIENGRFHGKQIVEHIKNL